MSESSLVRPGKIGNYTCRGPYLKFTSMQGSLVTTSLDLVEVFYGIFHVSGDGKKFFKIKES